MDLNSIQPAAAIEVETQPKRTLYSRASASLQSIYQSFPFGHSRSPKIQPCNGSSHLTARDAIDMFPDAVCIFSAQGERSAANDRLSALLGDAELSSILTDQSMVDFNASLKAVTSRIVSAPSAVAVLLYFSETCHINRNALCANHIWELRASKDRLSAMLIGRENFHGKKEASIEIKHNVALTHEHLSEQFDEKRQFIRCVCHEVRTPLSVIYSALYLLDNVSAKYKDLAMTEAIEEAKLSCQSAADTISALLLHQQLESNAVVLRQERVNVYSYIEDCVSAFHPATELWDITFTYTYTSKFDMFMSVSTEEFGLAMRALINNGVRYTPPKGMVRVVVSSVLDDGSEASFDHKATFIRISVSDSGMGLTNEAKLAILLAIEKFTPSSNETQQGHGVALSTVHGVAKLHGGRIGIESAGLGQGSTFFVEIPILEKVWAPTLLPKGKVVHQGTRELHRLGHLKKVAATIRVACKLSFGSVGFRKNSLISSLLTIDKLSEVQQEIVDDVDDVVNIDQFHPKIDEELKPTLRILLVDDVRACRRILARILEADSCVCDEAGDGLQAVEMVRLALNSGAPYDCILMDASMPKMTGSEATRAIREMGCQVKIFGVTGDSLPQDVQRFMDSGASGVCIKPLRKTELDVIIRGK